MQCYIMKTFAKFRTSHKLQNIFLMHARLYFRRCIINVEDRQNLTETCSILLKIMQLLCLTEFVIYCQIVFKPGTHLFF